MSDDPQPKPAPVAPPALGEPNRRQLLGAAFAATAASAMAVPGAAFAQGTVFTHGVASGDPLENSVVIWTRVLESAGAPRRLRWAIATDEAFTNIIRRGTAQTSADRDYTVKVDVDRLRPGRTYFYRFEALGAFSPIGRTRTLPVGDVSRLRFAVFSCANFEGGFFNAYREAARIDDLDAVLHLGDYIYEYADGLQTPAQRLGLAPQPRLDQLAPRAETVVLAQYRERFATYRGDADLQELHRKNAWITVWDDHEQTNDGWTDDAENHTSPSEATPASPSEGDWDARKAMAIRAYYEWMPIREPSERPRIDGDGNPQGLYREFNFGSLARLIMLDTRLAGRDEQLDGGTLIATYAGLRADTIDGTPASRARNLLGPTQESWLQGRVALSTQTWQLFGNQVLAFYQNAPDIVGSDALTPELKAQLIALLRLLFPQPGFIDQLLVLAQRGVPNPIATDAWTGYPTARARLLGLMAQARNPVVLTGDSHNAWTANLRAPFGGSTVPIGVEFGGTSVTSPGFEQVVIGFPPEAFAALIVESSARRSPTDKLIYTEQRRRGFLLVDVTPSEVVAEHVFLSNVFTPAYTVERQRFRVAAGSRTAVPA